MLKTDLVYLVIQTNEMISILSLDFFRLKNSPGGLGSQHLLKIHFKFLFNFENFRDKMLNLFHKCRWHFQTEDGGVVSKRQKFIFTKLQFI